MKKSLNSVSPFIMLLIPALLVIGFKSTHSTEQAEAQYQSKVSLQTPAIKAVVQVFSTKDFIR